MPRKFLRRILPDHRAVREYRVVRLFGTLLHDPDLWHLNRRSVSGAFALGLFWAFMPIPTQMLFSAGMAVLLRVNIPIAVATVWITNPITVPPIFYGCYVLGTWVLGEAPQHFHFELSLRWLLSEIGVIWRPLLTGCLLVSSVAAVLGYVAVRIAWRLHVLHRLHLRRAARYNKRRA